MSGMATAMAVARKMKAARGDAPVQMNPAMTLAATCRLDGGDLRLDGGDLPPGWRREDRRLSGRDDVERLIHGGELEHVTPSLDVADRLLCDADAHIGL
jgi:hypothetical protein